MSEISPVKGQSPTEFLQKDYENNVAAFSAEIDQGVNNLVHGAITDTPLEIGSNVIESNNGTRYEDNLRVAQSSLAVMEDAASRGNFKEYNRAKYLLEDSINSLNTIEDRYKRGITPDNYEIDKETKKETDQSSSKVNGYFGTGQQLYTDALKKLGLL